MGNNSVYIIGAGASKEVGLPTGFELKSTIANLLDIRFEWNNDQKFGDYLIAQALKEHVREPNGRNGDINPFLKEAWHIRDALNLAISIDNFIDAHRDNESLSLCGKLSIVRAIIEAEQASLLYFKETRQDSNINFSALENTWLIPFFQSITENCTKEDLRERFKEITLIIFNYDRCVEHFLFNAIINYYRISREDAAELVALINIYHPYGKVGSLPWQHQENAIEFGKDLNAKTLLSLSDGIKTFTEGTSPDSSDILDIKSKMETVDRLVFIGFAFHKLNMQLIKPIKLGERHYTKIRCYASYYGISVSDMQVIKRQIIGLFKARFEIEMTPSKCKDFFSEYWRSLSF